jgi:hypothetical protein
MLFWFLIPIPFIIFQVALDFANCSQFRGDRRRQGFFIAITWMLFVFGIWLTFYLFSEWPLWAKILSCVAAFVLGRVVFKSVFYSLNEKIQNRR